MSVAIVTTTIHVPKLLEAYAQNASEFGHEPVLFVVIGDLKTPPEAKSFCEDIPKRFPHEMIFLDVDDQKKYLTKYPELAEHLPYNSIQRRNIGMLLAYEQGADVLITIDDDNFFVDGDFVGRHAVVGTVATVDAITSSTGWLNVCEFLIEEHGYPFYHRGFPLKERWPQAEKVTRKSQQSRVAANAGLWLGDPDIDAITRLAFPITVTGFQGEENLALAPGTWSPFNSQNTAISREALPAYFLSPIIGRYDDIWASYVVKRIADHLGEVVTFGFPLVNQERNPHDGLQDLDREMDGMRLSDVFCSQLREIGLSGKTYGECFKEIHRGLENWTSQDAELRSTDKEFMNGYLSGMEVWIETIRRVGFGSS